MAFAIYGLGACAYDLGDFEHAKKLFDQSRALYEKIGDRWGVSECLFYIADLEKDHDLAKSYLQEILSIKKEIGDIDGIAYALKNLGIFAFNDGDLREAQSLALESLNLFRIVGNKESEARILYNLGLIPHLKGDYQGASQFLEEATAIYKSMGDDIHYAFCLIALSELALSQGDYEEARHEIENALRVGQETGNKLVVSSALLTRGRLKWIHGNRLKADKDIEHALELGRETGYKSVLSLAYYLTGVDAISDGDIQRADLLLDESLKIYLETHESLGRIFALEALASLAALEQRPERAAQLLGAANFPFNGLHINILSPVEREWREKSLTVARDLLGDEGFMEHWQKGFAMTPEQAVDYASAD